MPHNLTEVDAHTTPIAVPDGIDSRSNAAEVVEALAQALANRTNRLNLHAALKNVANTFTAGPQEVNVTDSLLAALVTRTTAADDAASGNKWKAVLGFAIGGAGGDYVNVYAGIKTGPGQFVITINAEWNTSDQLWHQIDVSLTSFAVILLTTGMFLSRRAAGAPAWSSWPAGAGDLTVGGDVTAYGALAVVGAIASTSAGISANGEYTFSTPRTRTNTPIPVTSSAGTNVDPTTNDLVISSGAFGEVTLRLPVGDVINGIDVAHYQATAGQNIFQLVKRVVNYGSPGATTLVTIGTAGTGTASSGYKVTTVATGAHTILAGTEYMLLWGGVDPADRLQGARIASWSANGPANV